MQRCRRKSEPEIVGHAAQWDGENQAAIERVANGRTKFRGPAGTLVIEIAAPPSYLRLNLGDWAVREDSGLTLAPTAAQFNRLWEVAA